MAFTAQASIPRASSTVQSVNILEELLLALLGHTGDVFLSTSSPEEAVGSQRSTSAFKTSSDLCFITAPQRHVMDMLLQLGFYYSELETFVKAERFSASRKIRSQYKCALANGIQELLLVYAAAILKLQQQMRGVVNPSLSAINYYLAEFKELLPCVHGIANRVQRESLAGSQILQLLQAKASCGIPEVQSCLERLAWHCYQVFYKQLKAWMTHGLLIDQCGEFMIQKTDRTEGKTFTSAGLRAEDTGIAFEWHRGFEVKEAAIPPEISQETAAHVLFIGKAVRVLRPPQASMLEDQLNAGAVLEQLQSSRKLEAGPFQTAVDHIREQAAEKLWQLVKSEGKIMQHLTALRDYFLMGRGDFWQNFLLESHTLMSLPVNAATAEANISIPFHQSCGKSSAEGDPLFAMLGIKFPLQAAATATAGSVPAAAPALEPKRSASVPDPTAKATPAASGLPRGNAGAQTAAAAAPSNLGQSVQSKETPANTPQTGASKIEQSKKPVLVPSYDPSWDPLTLEYQVKWPLHLILTPQAMMKYCRLFQYLFRLKRMQLEVDNAWLTIRGARSSMQTASGTAPKSQSLWHVQSHIAHFMTNLQTYVQVDVLEVQYDILVEAMSNARNLKAAEAAHEAFLAACITQNFLDVSIFTTVLTRFLSHCKSFCASLKADKHDVISGSQSCGRWADEYIRAARTMYRLLAMPTMQGRARAPFLRQLLLRLNFNDFLQRDVDEFLEQQEAAKQRAAKFAAQQEVSKAL